MTLSERVRASFRRQPLAYRLLYFWRQIYLDQKIKGEQKKFEDIARKRCLPAGEEAADVVFRRLDQRLAQRGLSWPPSPRGRPLHILYVSVPGNWERHNLPPELSKLGEVSCFFLEDEGISVHAGWERVRKEVDEKLPGFVQTLHRKKRVDMILSYLSGAQISPGTITAIGAMGIPTFSFHLDDRRAFYGRKIGELWSGPAALCAAYDLNLSNASNSLVKYRVLEGNVLFWPEGANIDYFRPLNVAEKYDVTFCGQRYGVRPLLVDFLRRHGVRVDCFGDDWEHGYVRDADLPTIFNQSRVNLGFGYVNESTDQCLKGRDFEAPSCGVVYLTSYNQDLPRVYKIGKEIETYQNFGECLQKVRVLLADKQRRGQLRQASRAAVTERHSWAMRVQQLLDRRGCSPVPSD